ncbi:hypothetical protein D3C76_68150 [compost metagenome]
MPEHVILRYGLFYGPGTWYATYGFVAEQVRHGELAASEGISSFVHVNDAACAAHLALDWPSGTNHLLYKNLNSLSQNCIFTTIYIKIYGGAIPLY